MNQKNSQQLVKPLGIIIFAIICLIFLSAGQSISAKGGNKPSFSITHSLRNAAFQAVRIPPGRRRYGICIGSK